MRTRTVPVFRVRLVREGTLPYPEQPAIRTPHDAAAVLMPRFLQDRDRETFAVLLLSTRNRVLGLHPAHEGTLDGAAVHPREVFKAAILRNAAAIIVGHNHPSGDPEPSEEDTRITAKLVEAGEILGIEVLDHLIIGEGRLVSLRERGLIKPQSRTLNQEK